MEVSSKFTIMVEELEKELKELKIAIREKKLAKIGGVIDIKIDESSIEEAKRSLFRES